MSINYPSALDDNTSMPQKVDGDTIFAAEDNDQIDALIALETKVGVDASADTSSVEYRLSHLATVANTGFASDLTGTLAAAQTPAFTGDVTKAANSGVTVLAAGSASNLNSGTLANARTAAYTGDVTKASGSGTTVLAAGSASVLNSGTLPAGRMPALTGEVTTSAGAVAATVRGTHSGSAHWGPTVKDIAYAGGALGDGSTDDGAAINAAIAAQTAPSTVIIPPGTYITSVPIVGKAGVSLRGIGRPIIRAKSTFTPGAHACFLDYYDLADPVADIEGIQFDANQKANIVVLVGKATGTAQAKNRIFHNVISGGNVSGLQVGLSTDTGSSSNVVVESNEFINPTGWTGFAAGASAMVTYMSDSWWFNNIHETTNGIWSAALHAGGIWIGNHFMCQTNGGGMLIDKGQNFQLVGNWFDHMLNLTAIKMKPAAAQSIQAVNVVANRFAGPTNNVDNGVPVIAIDGTVNNSFRALSFKDNIVQSDTTHAFSSFIDFTTVSGAKATVSVKNNELQYVNQIFTGTLPAALQHSGNRILTVSAQTGSLGTLGATTQYESEARGTASVAGGANPSTDITHGLAGTPTFVNVQMALGGAVGALQPAITLTTTTTTNDTIHLVWTGTPGAQTIYWEARL